jgi:hypothetical protein
MYDVAASRPRCLVVATGLTAALWGAAAVGFRSLMSGVSPGSRADGPLTAAVLLDRGCLAALVVVAVWAWLQAMAGVADAWRGLPCARRSWVRRLVLVACGVALTVALSPTAMADDATPGSDPLSGLPLPDRPEGGAADGAAGGVNPRSGEVVVRTGDTLWALAESRLPRSATGRQVTAGWHSIYRHNRGVIGPDPDLIRPGQVLKLTKEKP